MAGDLVLITGGTGHIGFRTVVLALQAGYHVRAAVRSQAKADAVRAAAPIKALNVGSRLSFVIVPDLTAPQAYDEAVRGVKYIIHLASPLSNDRLKPEEYEAGLITPAVEGTMGMLRSAQKADGVKRVVITSSVVAIAPWSAVLTPSDTVFTPENRIPDAEGPFVHPFQAYSASKARALNASDAWVRAEKPAFDVVNLHPSFVLGRDDLQTTPEGVASGTNRFALFPVTAPSSDPLQLPGSTVHLEDVARVHVQSLDPRVPGNRGYTLNWNPTGTFDGTVWDDAKKIAAKHFPNEVANGILPNNGDLTSVPIKFDTSETEKVFGFTHLDYETQVKSVVEHYLEVKA